jgi:hypothetical protein
MSKEKLDTTQPVELSYTPDFQDSTFTVYGDYEAVEPIASQIQALESAPAPKRRNVAHKVIEQAQTASEVLTGHKATVIAKLYDITTGASMYDLLQQKRKDERDLAMAKRLGLITTDRCAKHEKQLAAVRGLGIE